MGSGLLSLAVAAAIVTGSVLFIAEQTQPALHCPPGPSWRHQAALLAELPAEQADALGGAALPAVTGLAADVMRRVGWSAGTRFARFDGSASLEGVLKRPSSHAGTFLLIVPGNGSVHRRLEHQLFLSFDPSAASLAPVLGPAGAVMHTAVQGVEAALGRRLFAFQLESAPLPACGKGAGPCAVWEASSGRVVLDASLAQRMAELAGGATTAGPAARAGGDARLAASAEGGAEPAPSGQDLPALLAAFAEKLTGQVAEILSLLPSGEATLGTLASAFSAAGASSLLLLLGAGPPLWWCITCPIVLGMLAPFVFNFGLTAAAEALCAQLHLPDQTCTDLWWSAFALAVVLSLGAAVPIVYICHLPECGRRVAGAAAAAGAAVARVAAF